MAQCNAKARDLFRCILEENHEPARHESYTIDGLGLSWYSHVHENFVPLPKQKVRWWNRLTGRR